MRTEQEMVAYALEIDPDLLPLAPALLADLDELGSDAEQIAEVIADLNLTAGSTIVDLGCGKGATAVEIAEATGLKVTGIELFEPFVQCCEELAQESGVEGLCTFLYGNVLDMAARVGPFDVAVFAALGDVLGGPDETVDVIRDYVRPGGLMIISDLYLADDGSNDFPGFERYGHRDDTISRLTTSGDTLVKLLDADSDVEDPEELDDEDFEDEALKIRARAEALALEHPDLEQALMAFAESQAQENAFVEENLVDAIWILRKAS
jgi:SAM-dependent methyltransferase